MCIDLAGSLPITRNGADANYDDNVAQLGEDQRQILEASKVIYRTEKGTGPGTESRNLITVLSAIYPSLSYAVGWGRHLGRLGSFV